MSKHFSLLPERDLVAVKSSLAGLSSVQSPGRPFESVPYSHLSGLVALININRDPDEGPVV